MTEEEEHRLYHQQVSLLECGFKDCTLEKAFQMFNEQFKK